MNRRSLLASFAAIILSLRTRQSSAAPVSTITSSHPLWSVNQLAGKSIVVDMGDTLSWHDVGYGRLSTTVRPVGEQDQGRSMEQAIQ